MIETDFCVITLVLTWVLHIQNSNLVWYPITDKLLASLLVSDLIIYGMNSPSICLLSFHLPQKHVLVICWLCHPWPIWAPVLLLIVTHFANSPTAVTEPSIDKLLTVGISDLMSLFHSYWICKCCWLLDKQNGGPNWTLFWNESHRCTMHFVKSLQLLTNKCIYITFT